MNVLLDTHVLLWWLTDPDHLKPKARAMIGDGANLVFVSAASIWEMQIKSNLGKLQIPDDIEEQMRTERFEELPVRIAHAHALVGLPMLHRDPFDRMLVIQAREDGMILITRDPAVLAYGGKMLRA